MGILEFIVLLLVIGWAFGFFFIHLGALIHLLLVIAIIVFLLRFIRGGTNAV